MAKPPISALHPFNLRDNVRFRFFGLFVLCILTCASQAQDPVFSRYSAHPQSDNPAFTGTSRTTNVYMVYRNQYPAIGSNYVTYALGGATYIDHLRSGFGLSVLYDDSANGLYTTMSATGNYAYRIEIAGDAHLNIGLSLGYGRVDIAYSRLIFPDQIDALEGAISPGGLPYPTNELRPSQDRTDYIDMGVGGLVYMNQWYMGLSLNHLNNPANDFLTDVQNNSVSVDGLPMRWTILAGAELPLIDTYRESILSLQPQILYSRQNGFGQLLLSGYVRYKTVDIGVSYRLSGPTSDAIVLSTGIEWNKMKLYYAYDWTISELAGRTGGAHEIGLSLILKEASERAVDCFNFF